MPEATLPSTDFAHVDSIHWVNQKPHPFMIGSKHVVYASDHCCGMLTEDAIRDSKIPCAMKGCKQFYDDHTKGDHVAFVKLTKDVSSDAVQTWLKSIISWAEENKIDGFAFIDTGFRIIQ